MFNPFVQQQNIDSVKCKISRTNHDSIWWWNVWTQAFRNPYLGWMFMKPLGEYPAVIHPTTHRKNWCLATFCLPKFLSYHLEPQTTIYEWLLQLDDSKSLYRKWLFHQTSIYKWLFGFSRHGCFVFFWGVDFFTFFSAFAKGGVG